MKGADASLVCSDCARAWDGDVFAYRCACAQPWSVACAPPFSIADVDVSLPGLWRYRRALAVAGEPVTMGEGLTPLVDWPEAPGRVKLKCDFVCPTGSYKDRGASVLVTHLKHAGVDRVVEDSSGNAGAALAAYAARAGMKAEIFVPADAHPGKLAQMAAHGARVVRVPGDRAATSRAVLERAASAVYASHNWNPVFLEGTKSVALEIAEQLGWSAPEAVVCPLGFGSVLLGLWLGFEQLRIAGVIERVPRLVGVQSAGCDPITRAWRAGRTTVEPLGHAAPTPADGIAAAAPMRGSQILHALRASNGLAVSVEPEAVFAGMGDLARGGFYVEPTSAVVVDGYRQAVAGGAVDHDGLTVLVLTGSGLKATDSWSERVACDAPNGSGPAPA